MQLDIFSRLQFFLLANAILLLTTYCFAWMLMVHLQLRKSTSSNHTKNLSKSLLNTWVVACQPWFQLKLFDIPSSYFAFNVTYDWLKSKHVIYCYQSEYQPDGPSQNIVLEFAVIWAVVLFIIVRLFRSILVTFATKFDAIFHIHIF